MHNNNILIVVENNQKYLLFKDLLGENIKVGNTDGQIIRISDPSLPLGWKTNEKSSKALEEIKNLSKECEKVFLAMDNDADGERLAWDVLEFIKHPSAYRITPKELTKESITKEMQQGARLLDQHLINSYVARKVVESFVSKDISEMMCWWFKKERLIEDNIALSNSTIGRVSATALALIVQAEEKIDTFIPELYKRVAVDYFHNNVQFSVKNKLKFTKDKKEELLAFIEMTQKEQHVVSRFERNNKDKVPPPPLNTAWLQREASYQFQFSAKETIKIAMELSEGIKINGKHKALITFPKTSSVFLSDEVIYEIIQLLLASYGVDYTLTTKRIYKNADKNTTKEAIRPIDFTKEFFPKNIKSFLTEEQFKLYEYIYMRTIATQMTNAIYDKSELAVTVGGSQFRAIANKVLFDGWERIGQHWTNDDTEEYEEVILPAHLIPSEVLNPLDIRAYEIKERSPWRYGEGRFITTLEKYAISNASFISEITNFLETKKYISVVNGMIYPTESGKKIHYFLEQFAPWLVDLDFVAKFEQDIQLIASGKKDKAEIIAEYEALKNETQIKVGFGTDDGSPELWMIEKAKRIAKQKNIPYPSGIEKDRKKVLAFINQHKENIQTLGKCPLCKEGDVYKVEHGYKCNVKACSFVLWSSSITRFFNNFSKTASEEVLSKYMEIVFSKGKCFVDNFYSPKKEKFFNSYIALSQNEQYQSWEISFAKEEAEETEENKKLFSANLSSGENELLNNAHIEHENSLLKEQLTKEQEERRLITDEAKKDPLTRAFNRRCFDADIQSFFKTVAKETLSIAFVDGDKFKNVNDTYGHQAGDKVLQTIVNTMFLHTKALERARVYRYGGEEFLILFVGENKKTVLECLNEIRKTIENNPIPFEDKIISVTISAGVSFCSQSDTVSSFIERSDVAVYRAKENGRNRIEIGIEK